MSEKPQKKNQLETTAHQIVKRLKTSGYRAFWAGGSVRDMLLGRSPKDIDIATNARPDDIAALFPEAKTMGKAFGVMGVYVDGSFFEISTFRKDLAYSDGRRPDAIVFSEAEEDAQRRDFTINGLFFDPDEDRILDYVGGLLDLKTKTLRAIGDADKRFSEDYLRMMRAVRFASCLSFTIESKNLSEHSAA